MEFEKDKKILNDKELDKVTGGAVLPKVCSKCGKLREVNADGLCKECAAGQEPVPGITGKR